MIVCYIGTIDAASSCFPINLDVNHCVSSKKTLFFVFFWIRQSIRNCNVSKRLCVVTLYDGVRHLVGLFLPAVVRPILDSLEASKQVKAPPLTDVRI